MSTVIGSTTFNGVPYSIVKNIFEKKITPQTFTPNVTIKNKIKP
jgi:hypothetical protein